MSNTYRYQMLKPGFKSLIYPRDAYRIHIFNKPQSMCLEGTKEHPVRHITSFGYLDTKRKLTDQECEKFSLILATTWIF